MKNRLVRLTLPLMLALCGMPWLAHAAGPMRRAVVVQAVSTGPNWLALPFIVLLMMTLQVLLARGVKAVAASAAPLATGEMDVVGYARSVYGTPDRPMLEIVALGLLSGVVTWVGSSWHWNWVIFLGVLILAASLALDLVRWERVSVSSSQVWYQWGFGRTVHQVAIDNILDVTVTETDAPGFSLRHLNRNRRCRLSLRLLDKQVIALPKTDAYTDLDDVEAVANHIRTRQQLAEDHREAAKRSPSQASARGASTARTLASFERLVPEVPVLPPIEVPAAPPAEPPVLAAPARPQAASTEAPRPRPASSTPAPRPAAASPASPATAAAPTQAPVPPRRSSAAPQAVGTAQATPQAVAKALAKADNAPAAAPRAIEAPARTTTAAATRVPATASSSRPVPPREATQPAVQPPPIDVEGSKRDRQMMRDLMRLRQRTQASNDAAKQAEASPPARPPRKA